MPFINFNGLIATGDEPLLSTDNRALRYGEGLIETMLWRKKTIRLFDLHTARLQKDLARLQLPSITEKHLINEICRTVVANQEPGIGIIRCQFFTGPPETGLQFTIEYIPIAPPPGQTLRIGITRAVVKSQDNLSSLKTSSRLLYVMAASEAESKGWDDVLLLNTAGRIAESTISNIFWIKNGAIFTPPLNEGPVAGVMRQYLLNQGMIAGMHITEKPLDVEMLSQADEVFLTNAVRGVRPVHFIGNKAYAHTLGQKIADKISLL